MTEVAESPRLLSEYVRSLPTDVRTRYLAKTATLNCDPYYVTYICLCKLGLGLNKIEIYSMLTIFFYRLWRNTIT